MRARAKRALDRSRLKRRIAQTDEAVLRQRTVSHGEGRLLHGAMPQRWCVCGARGPRLHGAMPQRWCVL